MLRTTTANLLRPASSRNRRSIIVLRHFHGEWPAAGSIISRRLPEHSSMLVGSGGSNVNHQSAIVSIQWQSSMSYPEESLDQQLEKREKAQKPKEETQTQSSLSVPAAPAAKRQRPATAWERLRDFPKGMVQLWKDYLQYRNIMDTFKSPRNTWTLRKHVLVDLHAIDERSKEQYALVPPRIPRRQLQQVRRFRQDFSTVLPIFLLTAPPIIGYFPLIVAIAAPRQVLSRQFHNKFEILEYSHLAYEHWQTYYEEMGRSDVWKEYFGDQLARIVQSQSAGEDAAGPILDAAAVYITGFSYRKDDSVVKSDQNESHSQRGLVSWKQLPRDYLNKLGLACGIFQRYPSNIGKLMIAYSPRWWIQRRLQGLASIIRIDDTMLLEEGHDHNNCQSLTDLEVLDACLMRGLPVTISFDEMRDCLTHHLQMIKKKIVESPTTTSTRTTEAMELFLLHLRPIRYVYKK